MDSSLQRILARAQPGTFGGIRQHIQRGEVLRQHIDRKFALARPEQWKAKHVRWVLEHGLGAVSPATRYHYYRTARAIAAAMGHWPDWEPHLRGEWVTPQGERTRVMPERGGRPPKLAHKSKRNITE